jgi:hypothetical protein
VRLVDQVLAEDDDNVRPAPIYQTIDGVFICHDPRDGEMVVSEKGAPATEENTFVLPGAYAIELWRFFRDPSIDQLMGGLLGRLPDRDRLHLASCGLSRRAASDARGCVGVSAAVAISEDGRVTMGKSFWQTLQGEVLDAAADLDRAAGRDPQANDSALDMAARVYS